MSEPLILPTTDSPATRPSGQSASPDGSGWQSLPRAAARTLAIGGALWGTLLGIVPGVFAWKMQVEAQWPALGPPWAAPALLMLLCLAAGAAIGLRRWKFSQWKLDATGLHVRRGQFWRKEILVPRSRVQHLDIERGPLERHAGLATLIVHTAGTRLHAVRQAGFADADAVALRDALLPASDRHDDVV